MVDLILTSLTEEGLKEIASEKEKEWISRGINNALNIIYSNPADNFKTFRIVNEIACKVEMEYEWYNELSSAFICITNKNIHNPEFECDCSLGPNSGLCGHFWLGFIFSLKCGYFDLDNWKMVEISDDFKKKIKNIEIIKTKSGNLLLVDKSNTNLVFPGNRDSEISAKGEDNAKSQICKSCGNRCSPRAMICPKCNQSLRKLKNGTTAQICKSCGNKCSPRAMVCPKCNQSLRKLEHDTPSQICKSCGNKCSPRAKVCPKCNQKLKSIEFV